jgi:hypothetical protein
VLRRLFDGQGHGQDAAAAAAVLLGDGEAQQPHLAEGLEYVFRVLGRLIDLGGAGCDALLRDATGGLLNELVLLAELEVHVACSLSCSAP